MTCLLKNILNLGLLSVVTLLSGGAYAMSNDLELIWEWPAKRSIESRIIIQIESLEKVSSGLFNFGKWPSIASNLPDPYILKGTVLKSTSNFEDKAIQLIAPKLEIENIQKGKAAMLGLVDSKTCVCIVAVDDPISYLDDINCPKADQ